MESPILIALLFSMILISTNNGNGNEEENVSDQSMAEKFREFSSRDTVERAHYMKMLNRDIKRANLTSLVHWLDWTQNMKETLTKMRSDAQNKKEVDYEGIKLEGADLLERIGNALKFLDKYLLLLETELRDPRKSWNYPKTDKPS